MTRKITINPLLNGWLLEVGCQQVAFTDKQTMLNELSNYYDKPEETEKRFIERATNKTMMPVPPPTGNAEPMGLRGLAPEHPAPTTAGAPVERR